MENATIHYKSPRPLQSNWTLELKKIFKIKSYERNCANLNQIFDKYQKNTVYTVKNAIDFLVWVCETFDK